MRRRAGRVSHGSPVAKRPRQRTLSSASSFDGDRTGRHRLLRGILAALPATAYKLCAWAGEVFIAMTYAKYPLGALLAVYLVLGGLMVAQNMATRFLYAAVFLVCRVPGVALLGLPFCAGAGRRANATARNPVEFDDLVAVQARFEQVLERSADGVSLPFEMKHSEAAARDLRTLVGHSDVQARNELVLEARQLHRDGPLCRLGPAKVQHARQLRRRRRHQHQPLDLALHRLARPRRRRQQPALGARRLGRLAAGPLPARHGRRRRPVQRARHARPVRRAHGARLGTHHGAHPRGAGAAAAAGARRGPPVAHL